MGNIISKKNKEYINSNWNDLKCSPIGPLLQSIGAAPGDPSSTANKCQSNSFSNQFNSSMTDQFKATDKLNSAFGQVTGSLNKFRAIIATIRQQIYKNMARIADMIFSIYVKIGNIIMVINKNLVNIMMVFKHVINTGIAAAILLVAFMNLVRIPVNGLIKFMKAFCFCKNTLIKLKNDKEVKMKNLKLGDVLANGSVVHAVLKIANVNDEYFYKFRNKENNKFIYVTGSHYIYDENKSKYVMAKDHPDAKLSKKKDSEFSCIVTSDHKIQIGNYTFWDYEDDLLINK